ncbi:peptidase S8 [Chlorella sorokiniana]|uniref:Peptidase S8 n=1 Tax=Chlorella sorokiniana TaxID=3076 RepID=A0A2P6THD0_CHLSO|nr:peptidase S8 [Chlorella sorokiniana]|eukprot:PRW33666.1 peptidase S8 [Chlorella sorokiniana]
MSGGKPVLSSRVMGLKFMQRGREKEQKAAAEEAAEEREAEAHWVVEGARTRCVVLAEGDPPPLEAAGGGRISFGGFNTEAEERRKGAEAAEALAAAEQNPEGVVITDEGMAAALRKTREVERNKSVGSGAGRYFDAGGGANYVRKQHGGGKDRGGKQHGGKQHGGTLLLAVLCAVGLQSGASAAASASAAAGTRVPCSHLPELQRHSKRVAILGKCSPSSTSATTPTTTVDPSRVGVQSVGATSATTAAAAEDDMEEQWIAVWKKAAVAAASLTGHKPLSKEACAEGAAPGAGRFNASCTHRYASALRGFAARFSRSQLARFLDAYGEDLESLAPDSKVWLPGSPADPTYTISSSSGGKAGSSSSGKASSAVSRASIVGAVSDTSLDSGRWGLDRIDQASLPLDGQYEAWNNGAGVHAYIMDTGIRTSHEEFGYSNGQAGSRADEVFAAPSLDASLKGQDCEGHGTHVAAAVGGLSFGVAPGAKLHAVRILDCEGSGAVSDVLLALDWLTANAQRPAVITMSLGGEVQLQLDEAVRAVTQAGIHVVVAAGNEDMDACDTSPAREASAVTVGASDEQDRRLWLSKGKGSNYGECVDLFAPGTDILSAASGSDTAQQLRTGTSQAVPFVAGVIALILQNSTNTSPADMGQLLTASAARGKLSEVAGSGFASWDKSGSPNLLLQNTLAAPISVSPSTLGPITSAEAGPYKFKVVLSQQPAANVVMDLSVDASRASLSPSSLSFTKSDWQEAQTVTLTLRPWGSAASSPLQVILKSSSSDNKFDGTQVAVTLADRKGDTLAYPKVISQLPFSDTASTAGMGDDYSVVCGPSEAGDKGGAPDLVYYFKPTKTVTVTASLCGSSALATTFDARLYLLAGVDSGGALKAAACSNDACGKLPALTAVLQAGVGYAFVVDGANGASGQFALSITAEGGATVKGSQPPASLQSASIEVAAVGPAAHTVDAAASGGFSMVEVAGTTDRYWLLAPWSDCSSACQKTRSVTCYDGAGSELADSECGGSGNKPDTAQACADCSAQAPSATASEAAAAGSGSSSSSSGLAGTTLIIVAVAAGAAVAAAVAAGGFVLFRRSQRKRVEDRSLGGHGSVGSQPPMPAGKWTDEGVAADAIDVIPLPKHLRPIATGRGSRRSPRLQQAGSGPQPTQHVAAAAGDVAAAVMQQQAAGAAAYAQAVAQLQQYAPDYHVVHMPSPRLTGQDTGSPSGVRRSLRQRSPTRRPRGEWSTPDPPGTASPEEPQQQPAQQQHRLARGGSGRH